MEVMQDGPQVSDAGRLRAFQARQQSFVRSSAYVFCELCPIDQSLGIYAPDMLQRKEQN